MGVKIPTLYKQYTDLCLPGGTRFCGFNIDENFGHCVDGLVVVDLGLVKAKKRARYVTQHKMTWPIKSVRLIACYGCFIGMVFASHLLGLLKEA